jgi:magnesium-transporting ATPase (P-type)
MVDSRQVVPGDIIMISAGEQVAADIRVLEMKTANLKID